MKKTLALLLSLSLAVSLSACAVSGDVQSSTAIGAPSTPDSYASGTPAPPESSAQSTPAAPSEPEPVSVDLEFSSGNYTAGIDFPAGTYDIVAVSGGGNVSSSNAFSGGINAVMGTEDQNDMVDIYEQEYSNIDLSEGVVLSISGVTVRLTCDDASGAPLTPRNQEITETVDLGNGNFVAGEDFPAGVYNIVAVSGGGNVSSSNIYDGGINAILGTEDQNALIDMYEPEYKNIDLPEGTTLTIDGVQVQLVPSV